MRHHNTLITIALLIACVPAGVARAGFENLWIVNYTCHPEGLRDHRVWRVYARFTNPGDRLVAVFGSPASPATISGTFFQHAFAGNTAPDASVIAAHPDAQWDTFFTIGLAVDNGTDQTLTSNLPQPPMTNNTNMSWSVPPSGYGQGAPDADRMVLISQLTIPGGGTPSNFNVGIAYRPAGSSVTVQVNNVNFVLLPLTAGDVNHDLNVNVQDVLRVIQGWGTSGQGAPDVTDDGTVNVADLLQVIENWGLFTGSCS